MHRQAGSVLFQISDAASAMMAVLWIWSGAWKATHPASFAEIIQGHGVLPPASRELGMFIPGVEIIVGISLIALLGVRPKWAVAASAGSIMLLIGFTFYIMNIPVSALAEYGCGCHGSTTSGVTPRSHANALLLNGALIALQSIGLAGPLCTLVLAQRGKTKDATST